MRRAKTPFARCPCTKTAICAAAVNHPHHINANHSSDKCQQPLVHALIPVNPSIRRKRASSGLCPPTPARRDHARGLHPASRLPSCAQNFLPNLTQSLAISRVSLVHLYVPLTFQRIGQRGDSNRLPAARRLRFARCPCTKTAICAVAVNHPHHINHVNHSSDKCQPALVHALIPVNPSNRRKKASSARRDHPREPSPASRLPSCAQNFLPNLTQSLANSRLTLLHLYVTLIFQRIGQRGDSYRLPAARTRLRFARCPCTKTAICAAAVAVNHPHHINCVNHSSDKCQPSLVRALIPVNPFHPPPKALQRGPYSPGPRRDARGLHQPPVCPVAPKISHTISHILS